MLESPDNLLTKADSDTRLRTQYACRCRCLRTRVHEYCIAVSFIARENLYPLSVAARPLRRLVVLQNLS